MPIGIYPRTEEHIKNFKKSIKKYYIENFGRKYKPIRCIWKDNGCLELTEGFRKKQGYGQIKRDGRQYITHRWIFLLNNGFLPEIVMHTCDNPRCINPLHLVEGTHRKNMEDMVSKKRQAVGERNGGGKKLTEKQVIEIKKLISSMTLQKIADKYGVSKKMILLIKQNKRWKYLNDL